MKKTILALTLLASTSVFALAGNQYQGVSVTDMVKYCRSGNHALCDAHPKVKEAYEGWIFDVAWDYDECQKAEFFDNNPEWESPSYQACKNVPLGDAEISTGADANNPASYWWSVYGGAK